MTTMHQRRARLSRRKLNLSRCSGCAYEFRAILDLLQSCSLTGQSFLIFAPSEGSAVVKRQRGGACQGAAMCGGFCHCSVDGGRFPADDVLPGALDRYRGDQRSEFLWRLPGWADDADEPNIRSDNNERAIRERTSLSILAG